MGSSKKPIKTDTLTFIAGLQNLLDSLPSNEQRQEATKTFKELTNFLNDLRDKVLAMPAAEEVANLKQSLSKLEDLFTQAEKNLALAKSVGINNQRKRSSSRSTSAAQTEINVREALEKLRSLPADQITLELSSKSYSALDVQVIARELGLSKTGRKTQAENIAKQLATERMRNGLNPRSEEDIAQNG